MDTKETANNQAKDWRKQGLGWVPDYPDKRDYLLDHEEVQKNGNPTRNSNNLRRNEVTKSIEDIAESLIKLIETLQKIPGQETLESLKTELESQIFGEVQFVTVKVYSRSLKLGICKSPEVRQLKYYLQLLSSHPKLSDFNPESFFENKSTYFQWLNISDFDDNTKKIVEVFQTKAKIRVDGIVGVETYTAISKFLGDIEYFPPDKNNNVAELLPIPIWIKGTAFQILFDTLKSWWLSFKKGSTENEEIALENLLKTENPQAENQKDLTQLSKFQEIFYQEFYVVEPLVSAITEMISPFAIQNDLKYALKIELEKFNDLNKELGNSSVKGAILNVAERLEQELKGLKDSDKTQAQKSEIRTFYEFIQFIVKGYIDKYSLSKDQKLLDSFSPLYLFEFEEHKEDNKDLKKQSD
ncbi:MAG: peptidoglycan-binding protein [Microcoleus sp.]